MRGFTFYSMNFGNRIVSLRQDPVGSVHQLAAGDGGVENGLMPPPHNAYINHGERARAMSASGKVRQLHFHIWKMSQ